MHAFARWALPALLVAAPAAALADDPAPFRIGVGGSFDVGTFVAASSFFGPSVSTRFTNVTVPVWIGSLRVEPEIGYASASVENKDTFEGVTETESVSSSAFRLGGTVAWSWELVERTRLYVGPRIGVIFRSTEDESSTSEPGSVTIQRTTSATDFFVGAALGGEAFLTPNFSLGVEAQATYVNFGEPETERKPAPEPPPDPDLVEQSSTDGSTFGTQVLISARVYFL